MVRAFTAMIVDDAGAAMVEYAIVAAAVAVPIIGVAVAIATGAGNALNTTSTGIQNFNQSPP
jgi:Flp pilus assembly pilin Flp